MKLALFDLDHTLIPFDSGLAWTRFLIARGELSTGAEAVYLDHCHLYAAGTLDIHAMHRDILSPLSRHARPVIEAWSREFEAEMAPRLPAAMRDLVRSHQAAGDLCAIVTATTRLVAEPFARLFGLPHLLATEAATEGGTAEGAYTGEIAGEPCFRGHKVTHVARWLAHTVGPGCDLRAFDQTWFYSDSASDLPLLEAVSHPVAVRPDPRLQAHAQQRGWRVMR